jgi:ribosomal protein L22
MWDSLSKLRSCLCERWLERTVLRPALLPIRTAQFTQFFHQVWRHTVQTSTINVYVSTTVFINIYTNFKGNIVMWNFNLRRYHKLNNSSWTHYRLYEKSHYLTKTKKKFSSLLNSVFNNAEVHDLPFCNAEVFWVLQSINVTNINLH